MGKTHEALQRAEKEYHQKLLEYKSETDLGLITGPEKGRSPIVRPKRRSAIKEAHNGYRSQYESIKSNLLSRYPAEKLKTMVFTGTAYGDGTSTTALNLASALARDPWRSVLLIDADIRRPCLHEIFNVDLTEGLSDFLTDEAIAEPHSNKIGSNFYFFTSGLMGDRAVGLFESEKFGSFLDEMKRRFDYVILDCPPVSTFPETRIIAGKAEGVVLVMNAGKTRQKVAMRAKKDLAEAGAYLLGAVLNRRKYYIPNWLYKKL
jgi:capsular exopolysaccharide synthesis family protein